MRVAAKQFEQGSFFHIYNHAAQGMDLFRDEADYSLCMSMISLYLKSDDFTVASFCLMPNHYHFLIRQNADCPIYYIMNKIWFRYSKYLNKKYRGRGSVFAAKAQHKWVDQEAYLLFLIAYIHLNPVAAGLVSNPADWEWSNFREWAGTRDSAPFARALLQNTYYNIDEYSKTLEGIIAERQLQAYLLDG